MFRFLPLLEHDNGVKLQVLDVNMLEQLPLVGTQITDLRKYLGVKELFVAVVRIVGRFECLMMQSMQLDPIVN